MLGEFDDLGGGVLREELILPDAIGNVNQTVCATNKEIVVNSVIPHLCVSSSILLAHNEDNQRRPSVKRVHAFSFARVGVVILPVESRFLILLITKGELSHLLHHIPYEILAKRGIHTHAPFRGRTLLSILLVERAQHQVVDIDPHVASPVILVHSEELVVLCQGAQSVLAPQLHNKKQAQHTPGQDPR